MTESVKDLNAGTASPVLNDGGPPDPPIVIQPEPPAASTRAVGLEPPKEDAKKPDEKKEPPKAPFSQLFYFVEGKEKILVVAAGLLAVGQGLGMPLFSFIFGGMADTFSNSDPDTIASQMNTQLIYMIILACVILVVATFASILWNLIAGKQSSRIKAVYFRKLLYQNTTWYDNRKVDQVAASFIDQISSLTAIFSEKIHMLFMSYSTVFGGLIIGMIKGYALTLLLVALTPILFIALFFFIRSVMKAEEVGRESYAEAGSITDECFTYIKTVKSLCGEEHEIDRYSKSVVKAKTASIKFGWIFSLSFGGFFGSLLLVYGLAYLIGSRLIQNRWYNANFHRDYQVGDVLTIFFSVIMGVMSLGQIGPIMKSIAAAQVAVASIIEIIKNEEVEKCGTYRPEVIRGEFVFDHVSFAYPSNKTVMVLKNVNMRFEAGKKSALVGPSGCGKSTIVGLLQRYYDPTEGTIFLDGVDLREYDIKYLRSKIGMVSQQPMLFADSIRFNMTLGTVVGKVDEQAIWEALELAEARKFVEALPNKLDEFVGSMGGQLSGGQKQRIAIARALIRKPDVFLFDEATSALDRTNEMEIQHTIDTVAHNRSSVTIAHRLTTIKDADTIFVFKKGELMEQGNHEALMASPEGVYRNLVKYQVGGPAELDDEVEELADDSQSDSMSQSQGQFGSNEQGKSVTLLRSDAGKDGSSIQGSGVILPVAEPQKAPEKPIRYKSIYSLLGPEKKIIPVGILGAMLQGCVMPAFGLLMGSMLQLMSKLSCLNALAPGTFYGPGVCFGALPQETMDNINYIVIAFVCVAVAAFFFTFWQTAAFNILGEKFTFNLRQTYFRRLMFMDMKYFDRVENQPGALSARLATQCKKVNILVGTYLGTIVMAVFSFSIGIILAFVFSWRVSLITLAVSPLMVLSAYVSAKQRNAARTGGSEQKKVDGSEMLTESINNMRVVRSLTAEEELLSKFKDYDVTYKRRLMKESIIGGIMFGLSQFCMFMIYATVFRVSVVFIQQGTLTPENMFRSMFSMLFGVFGIGQASQHMSEIEHTREAARVILADMNTDSLIEVDPKNPAMNPNPHKGVKKEIEGRIDFKNVVFKYESRKQPVLNRLNLRIPKGNSCAFVGSSGCGKSTLMQLLMRFYDPDSGQILLDGVDLRDYDLEHLRRSFGVVRQEPSLFNGTIDYNIRYNHKSLTDEEIKNAADLANATEFVYSTPEGFARNVGNRGEKLSGGQKQRIAIARVVAQKPLIYLFDEATSALDSNSEEVVQKAIEKISTTATSLTIAHRISTIKHCDIIFVIELGRVIEKGGYDRLMALNGKFAELARG